jgi:hypothetical protein
MSLEPSDPGLSEPGPVPAAPQPRTEVKRPGPSAIRTALDALRAMVPIVEGVARAITVYALVTLAAAVAIWWLIYERGATSPGRSATLLVWAIVLALPGAMLLTVAIALRLLAGLPDRLAQVPERAREHASSLGHLASEARQVRRRGWARSGWSVVRLWRAAAASKDVIGIAAPVAFLFTPMTLLLAIVAMAAGGGEILFGAIALLVLLLT